MDSNFAMIGLFIAVLVGGSLITGAVALFYLFSSNRTATKAASMKVWAIVAIVLNALDAAFLKGTTPKLDILPENDMTPVFWAHCLLLVVGVAALIKANKVLKAARLS